MNNIEFHDTYIKLFISKSKTDIYRRGSSIIIAKTSNDLCPVFWLKLYIDSAGLSLNSDSYLLDQFILSSQKVFTNFVIEMFLCLIPELGRTSRVRQV